MYLSSVYIPLLCLAVHPIYCCAMTSPPATYRNGLYYVAGTGAFTHTATYDFTSGNSLPAGLVASSYTVHDRASGQPYNHHFTPANVAVANGFLQLKVPGGQSPGPHRPCKCGEVSTTESHILHGSVRTLAIFGNAAGTVAGQFFYYNDTQEIDIEWVSDANSGSNKASKGNGTRPMQYTNQNVHGNHAHDTFAYGPSPADDTTAVHEYRIDWVEGKSMFYLDGILQDTFTTNVPTTPGSWIWNNWSNGDKGFTVGPPKYDNIFKIQKIQMYYNVSG